jgi:hypothetical protein
MLDSAFSCAMLAVSVLPPPSRSVSRLLNDSPVRSMATWLVLISSVSLPSSSAAGSVRTVPKSALVSANA